MDLRGDFNLDGGEEIASALREQYAYDVLQERARRAGLERASETMAAIVIDFERRGQFYLFANARYQDAVQAMGILVDAEDMVTVIKAQAEINAFVAVMRHIEKSENAAREAEAIINEEFGTNAKRRSQD